MLIRVFILIFTLISHEFFSFKTHAYTPGNIEFDVEIDFAEEVPEYSFLERATELNRGRLWGVSGGLVGTWGITLIGLNELWYKDYERTSFQFFDDSREWLQMDKVGHVYNSYYMSRFGTGLYRWTGLEEKKAIWIGGLTGTFLLSAVEILDGFSAEWGFSISDFGANMLGSGIVIAQELAWQEQRISIKLSAFPQNYPDKLTERAEYLYGTGLHEMVLKDYNAITGWLSVNPASFLNEKPDWLPAWLNMAVGYGAGGMYGGFENVWCGLNNSADISDCPPEMIMDYSHIPRVRKYYLSPDIDFSRIETNSKVLDVLLEVLNIVKLPAPALEYNSQDKLRWHWLFF
ncbi:MAG: DUF2279 domain-containing protein [Chitinophagaceae bacterium]|nr:MAG: DUF2279 domain-containing protein [Chitinophagaceae bacterium]